MSHWEPYKYPRLARDSQRQREYRSEYALKRECPQIAMDNRTFELFLRQVATDDWFTERFSTLKFKIQFSGRRHRSACCHYSIAKGFVLQFPSNGSMNYSITGLHELMHIVCHKQDHGPIFCTALLQVVTHYMGKKAGQELRRQYGIHRVQLVG